MARRFRLCVVEGCGRRSQLGQLVCKDHEGTELGLATSRQVVKLEREIRSLAVAESEEERRVAAKRFQRRVERGDFAAIFSGRFKELLDQGSEQGLENVSGALQIAVVRLLMEERDPTKMATALSKVAHAFSSVIRAEDLLDKRRDEDAEDIDFDVRHHTTREEYAAWREGKSIVEIVEERERHKQGTAGTEKVIEAEWSEPGEVQFDDGWGPNPGLLPDEGPPLVAGGTGNFIDLASDLSVPDVPPFEDLPLPDRPPCAGEGERIERSGGEELRTPEMHALEMQRRQYYLRRKMWDEALEEWKPRKG